MTTPIKRFIEAGNEVIAEGMAAIARDNPEGHAAALEFARAGAFPRIIVETHPERTTIDLVLIGADGDQLRVCQYNIRRVPAARH